MNAADTSSLTREALLKSALFSTPTSPLPDELLLRQLDLAVILQHF